MIEIYIPPSLFAFSAQFDFSSGNFNHLKALKIPGVDSYLDMKKLKIPKAPIDMDVIGKD